MRVFIQRGNSNFRTYLVFYFEDKNAKNMKITAIYVLMRCGHIKKRQHSCCSQQVIHRSRRWLFILYLHIRCPEITGHFLMLQERHSAVGSSFHSSKQWWKKPVVFGQFSHCDLWYLLFLASNQVCRNYYSTYFLLLGCFWTP